MKVKTMFAFFYLAMPILFIARILQQLFMIDSVTGFYKAEYSFVGTIISATFFGYILVSYVLASLGCSRPAILPKQSNALAVGSFLLACVMLYSSASSMITTPVTTGGLVMSVLSAGCAVFFIWYGISLITTVYLPKGLPLLPVVWGVGRLIVSFMKYTGQANIPDNLFDITLLCLTLVFLFAQAKLLYGISPKKNTRILYGIGFASALFCADCTLPRYLMIFRGQTALLHGKTFPDPVNVALFVYILIFLTVLYKSSKKNENA